MTDKTSTTPDTDVTREANAPRHSDLTVMQAFYVVRAAEQAGRVVGVDPDAGPGELRKGTRRAITSQRMYGYARPNDSGRSAIKSDTRVSPWILDGESFATWFAAYKLGGRGRRSTDVSALLAEYVD